MSNAAITWADQRWPIPDAPKALDPTSGAILAKLAAVSDDDDFAWMTVPDLAERVKCSERTVQTRLLVLRGVETFAQRKAREAAGKPPPAVYIRLTDRTYRRGTRDVPIYELMVDYDVVSEVLEKRRNGRRARAEVAAKPPKTSRPMGATVCTHSGEADDAVCTRMGATVCTPNEDKRGNRFANAHPAGARTLEARAETILAAQPEAWRQRSSVRELVKALRVEQKSGSDLARVEAGCLAYASNGKAHGPDGGPMAPHKLIASGRWETSAPGVDAGKGSSGARTGFAGPDDVRIAFLVAHGAAMAASYLDPCGWRDADQTLLARTGAAERWLREHGYRVERLLVVEGAR